MPLGRHQKFVFPTLFSLQLELFLDLRRILYTYLTDDGHCHLMRELVFSEGGAIPKRLLATPTRKRRLLGVAANVSRQRLALRESLSTVAARVGLLASMHPLMDQHVFFEVESKVAVVARESRGFSVRQEVVVFGRRLRGGLRSGEGLGRGRRMGGVLMISQRLLAGEKPHALSTADPREVHFVMLQFGLQFGEHPRTVVTRVDGFQEGVVFQMQRHGGLVSESHAAVEASERPRVTVFVQNMPLPDILIAVVRFTLCTMEHSGQRLWRAHRLRIPKPSIIGINWCFWSIRRVDHFESKHLFADLDRQSTQGLGLRVETIGRGRGFGGLRGGGGGGGARTQHVHIGSIHTKLPIHLHHLLSDHRRRLFITTRR